ncbi:hypothetical protein TI05_03545 [Achromatium sp. WMS3]|nr:hypothetical protein TI05_03545 [Achromatium sp. WMS3]
MNAELLRKYLKMHRKPITKYQDATVVHKELCQSQPEFYMELLKNNLTHLSHKQEIFLNIISLNCNSLAGPQTAKIVTFLQALPIEQSLQLIDILPKLKVNCSRIRNLGMNYLLGHESFATLAATKSLRIQRLLKHFLGERTWSACKRFLKNPGTHGKKFLHHKLWRYANNIETTHEALCFLAKVPYKTQEPLLTKSLAARKSLEQGKGLPLDTLFGLRGTLHPSTLASKVRLVKLVKM